MGSHPLVKIFGLLIEAGSFPERSARVVPVKLSGLRHAA
jgi:hypothetical protein